MRKNGPFALAFHGLFLLFLAAPLITIVLVSFTAKGYLAMPFDGASLRWYRAVFDAPEFGEALRISLLLGVVSASIALTLAVPAALALTRWSFPCREAIHGALMSPLLIPHIVLGVAFLRFFTRVGLSGTFVGMVLAHVVIVMPYAMRLCLTSAGDIDHALEQAAMSLGASVFGVFRRITLRLLLPGVVSGWMLAFIHSFDELTMSAFISSPSLTPLPVRLYLRIEDTVDPMVAAVSTLLIVGALVLILAIDRLVGLDRLFGSQR
ncbi:ABC transporter permease [Burkholderia pseudomallei]|uniref:ABC transporter permease n=1 Tax=Burkholderia pseudomallei TaxID=28450 RepID=UPI0021F77FA1|nr:ABC transporter permease [Burkholderia pseudomallei]MCW0161121.1 ABC transporter permease [Burkholderia pseudomallei]